MEMNSKSAISILVALALPALTTGCGDDTRPPGDSGMGDTSVPVDTGTPTDSSPPMDSSVPATDGNDSFEEAVALTLNDGMGAMERIQAAGDRDFFSVDLTADDWLLLATEANPDDDTEMVDTVIQLFDGPDEANMVAENDDALPRVNTDSELIYHVPADGTYYIRVLEWSDWTSTDPLEGDPSFTYTLTAGTVDPSAAVVTIDGETGNDAASAQTVNTDMDFGIVLGTFADAADIDVFSFSVSDRTAFFMMPSGVEGFGSTAAIGDIYVTNMAGTEIIARLNNSMNSVESISPAVDPGDYLLFVEHASTAAGANDFFVLKGYTGFMENPAETMEATNGTLAGAEALTQERDMDTMLNQGFILAQMSETDVDYFSFDVADGEIIYVSCGSRSVGSGVMGLTAEVRDDTDTVVDMQLEDPSDGIFIDGSMSTPPGAGTYYLRLTATGQDAEITGAFVRCGVSAGDPPPAM
jgi:hypothetical protein